MQDLWDTEENRRHMANRLRAIAMRLDQGLIMPEDYSLEPEWKGESPTGKITLTLSYRTKRFDEVLSR